MIHKPFIGQITENFHSKEFQCHDVLVKEVPGYYTNNMIYLATQLEVIRDVLQLPQLRINSAYRTKQYNKNIGGAENSNHLTCMAADITQDKFSNERFYQHILKMVHFNLIPDGEILKYETFVHYSPRFDWRHLPQQNLNGDSALITFNKIRKNAIIKTQKLTFEI